MTIDVSAWESAVREQVRIIAGDWADEVTAAWATFADEPLVVVTLHGGYDTGKTSLIKRFLVEDGTPLPDGLDVGARPTSYRGAADHLRRPGVGGHPRHRLRQPRSTTCSPRKR